jgi:hypothetical protein
MIRLRVATLAIVCCSIKNEVLTRKKQTGFRGIKKSKPFFKVQVYNDGCVPFGLHCSKNDHEVDFTKPLVPRANVLAHSSAKCHSF